MKSTDFFWVFFYVIASAADFCLLPQNSDYLHTHIIHRLRHFSLLWLPLLPFLLLLLWLRIRPLCLSIYFQIPFNFSPRFLFRLFYGYGHLICKLYLIFGGRFDASLRRPTTRSMSNAIDTFVQVSIGYKFGWLIHCMRMNVKWFNKCIFFAFGWLLF